MSNFYVEQHPQFGLGNFINLTPTLQYLAGMTQKPVPVFFDKKFVEQCFKECPFITPIHNHEGMTRMFGSDLINQQIPDWQFVFANLIKQPAEIPWTYVDRPEAVEGDYIVVIRGSGLEDQRYIDMKDPGEDVYDAITAMAEKAFPGTELVFIGSDEDLDRYGATTAIPKATPRHIDTVETGDIRRCLARIHGARFVISNDSGLYHAAAAMRKRQFCMWKRTHPVKNAAPNDGNLHFSHRIDAWVEDFERWVRNDR